MALNQERSVSILYDLAMSMAGETRTRPLATLVLQRLMHHTGSSCGAVLINPSPSKEADKLAAEVLVTVGNPTLRALEGKPAEWPAGLLSGKRESFSEDWLPGGSKDRFAISLDLPELGCILLFFARVPSHAEEYKQLFAPVMKKFARSLRHCLDSDAKTQALALSEARFRDIFETSPDWIWEINAEGLYTYANNRVFDLLGYTREEVLGKTPFDFMPPQQAKHIGWTFRDIIANRRQFFGLENVNLHKDGHEVILETSGVPVIDEKGNLLGYRGIDRDITLRKRAEEALLKAKAAAEASSQAKSVFLSSMSHELRTPLNAILGHAQLISMINGLPEMAVESAREIMQAGENLLSLMNDILELAALEINGTDMHVEVFPLAGVLDDCVAQNADIANLHKIPIECSTTCADCQVAADRFFLLQALNQLVSNAIKFNHDGGKIGIACRAGANGRVRVSISDTGSGIPRDDMARLFEPFNRLGAEKGQIKGAGVGLAIVRRLIEAMSGAVGVDSTPGTGSTFWVELPVAAPAENSSQYATPPQPAEAAPAQRPCVLVAEDYAPNQAILAMQLSSLGFEHDLAADGTIALKMWKEKKYDLVLADLNMPETDGLALARAIREHESGSGHRTPIICITADSLPADKKHCMDAGMDDVLTKPILLEALQEKLRRWLGQNEPSDAGPRQVADERTLDLTSLHQILGVARPEQSRALVSTFIEAARQGLLLLTPETAADEVAREMHKQKSSARTVGALRYARQAEALEKIAKAGKIQDFKTALAGLDESLRDVEAAFARLQLGEETAVEKLQPLSALGALLVVDDDPVILQQMAAMLDGLGAREVLTACNGHDALKLLSERNGNIEALICDLNMPAMDGVEVIRLFGRTGYRGKLILMSGADEKLLSTAGKLADLQGLRVLGQVQKPVSPQHIVGLLSQRSGPRTRKRQNPAPPEVLPEAIRSGIDKDEFSVWFQPKVDAVSLKPVGIEALARWHHPSRGIMLPNTFIGVAEREGLIGELSQVLTSKALIEGARLHAAGFPLTIAINLSGLWLDDLRLPDFVLATALAARLKPQDIILEVTETGVLKDLTTALDVLTRLRLKGFGLSIDDFGIGYSSFEQLHRIPFTELKLDHIFVSKGVHDPAARAILQGSMDMARKMSLSTVAEGVETEADLNLVRQLGCDRAQGYLIAPPMPVEDLIAWLKRPGTAGQTG
ncbi:EAL domain-containing protein [Betaproteobacteria bacterium SCN2]|jgi:PAS domain S-box-containing protein|nr:EAL domain-containing protein [Betaproteobacteria bacterium SCN2]